MMRSVAILILFVVLGGCVVDADYSDDPLVIDLSMQDTQPGEPVSSTEPTEPVAPTEPVEPTEPVATTDPVEPTISSSGEDNPSACDLEMSWARTSSDIFAHSTMSAGGLHALMPNHPVVIGSHVERDNPFDEVPLVAYRLEDGAPVFHISYEEMMGVHDSNWYTRAEFQHAYWF